MALSSDSLTTAGVLLLAIVAVEYGGTYLLRVVRGGVHRTGFQRTFARAGHAHAAVLVVLALVGQILVDAARMEGIAATVARNGIPWAAILMPAGFFLSSAGRGASSPNRLIVLLYAGVVVLTAGVVSLGVGLILAA